jgi:signal transduction histidine kinase
MRSRGLAFRVPEKRDAFRTDDPKFVHYRLEPETLDFAEINGYPERLLGFPLDDWYRPRFWLARIHPEDQGKVQAFLDGWAEARRDEQLEYRVIDAAGQTVWVQQLIAVGRGAGQEAAIRGVLLDITDRIACEMEVEKAMFLQTDLFRIVAEELAPPVRAISVYSEMLERHLAAQRDDVGSDYAVALRDGLQRLDSMLGQLARIAQIGVTSIDELNAGLAAFRGGRPAG